MPKAFPIEFRNDVVAVARSCLCPQADEMVVGRSGREFSVEVVFRSLCSVDASMSASRAS